MNADSKKTRVLDAGGRFGLHPTWKDFSGELDYYLFEPDPPEAERLRKKYEDRIDEIKVVESALLDSIGETRIYTFRNQAMSSSYQRNPVSALFKGEREQEVEIVGYFDAKTVTVDSFCDERGISLDFMKLDTEGSEYAILNGAIQQIDNSVMGVRSEVNFDNIFEGTPLFSTLHDFMLDHGYYLLNLNYDGRGHYCNDAINADGKYGILTECDAVWLKRRNYIYSAASASNGGAAIRVFKYAAFCLTNSAADVALDVLLEARREHLLDFNELADTRLYHFLDVAIHRLFYNLRWQPGQSIEKHKKVYSDIFDRPMKEMHEFNQSLEMNPS
jgi:FkbM family methyltransferase